MTCLNSKISVLFVRTDSIYKTLVLDCYDITRDARLYPGPNPIIAHPPCRAWSRMKHFAKPRPDEKQLAIFSISKIRELGGVLEHPSGSSLWSHLNLPLGKNYDEYGGFTISVNQFWFGHLCQKRTLLYICGCTRSEVPSLPLKFDAIEHQISSSKRNSRSTGKKDISKASREETPLLFAQWLIQLASQCVAPGSISI